VLTRRRGDAEALRQLQAEGDVHGSCGVGDGAGGDVVGAGFGVGADGFERDAAAQFDLSAASDFGDPVSGFGGGEVIEEEVRGAGIEGFAELFAGAHFDFGGASAGGAGSLDGGAHSAGGGDVIVLDQDRVVEAHAVIV